MFLKLAIIFLLSSSVWADIVNDQNSALLELKNRIKDHSVGAHQGGLAKVLSHWPNTLSNFDYARNTGADIVEMDLHTTKDGVVIVYHDGDLKTWMKCSGLVHEKTFDEIRNCRFKFSSKAQIPTFEEVLNWSKGSIVVDAEFKDFESIKPALDLVKKYNSYAWTYFQTQGNKEKFETAHAYDPKVALLYAIHNESDLTWALNKSEELLIVEINPETRNEKFINLIHEKGKLVTEDAWHFSKTQELFKSSCKKAFENKIDIAISNRPAGCVKERLEF